ncbi:MAG: ABC transporter ATP-binding protein [Gallionellales bacterium 35-53-114]|jgi:ABC-2 type transport system ATP-binding protein|nr:MAG: ABC transporter ATP-binding protein [Gallionellales bacterium 35-53-114]OYZ63710.1 MAG: ABC transporter ATP-binding protein [Gallionellales bacterium 24-53-125]OZB09457.1 MAG: ABC transporter ATP-binding protein [Gallionellales bacterium 39-52-133]HQS57878.1 ATP-binding cassette domain-containing protein [Gallionellaceae bacterium]HQS76039.1 ATP-binding cassette domain-containing protein [Gallionellaceae bacterium]
MSAQITLNARNLSRRLGRREVIRNISLQLKRGEVLGLLGPNGAGKSTTMQLLSGVLIPHAGQIEICGINLAQEPGRAKACIGYLPEHPPLYRDMRVDDFLLYAAKLHGVARSGLAEALAIAKSRCGLEDTGRKIIGTLSKGYQQRVGIAQAIIHNPDVVILDEPTVGLDPSQIRDIRALIRELGNAHSVILSTHLLGEVENICDRVEIMQRGQLIYGDTSVRMQSLGHQAGFIVTLQSPPEPAELYKVPGVVNVEALSATRFKILHSIDANTAEALLSLSAQQGWQAQQLTPLQGNLEDAFVHITQKQPNQHDQT